MYHLSAGNERVKPGADVAAVFYVDSEPRCLRCRLVATGPFTLETTCDEAHGLKAGSRLMLLVQGGEGHTRAAAEVRSAKAENGVWHIEIEKPSWEDLDKRTYPRYGLEIPIQIRSVADLGDRAELLQLDASTADLSLGGAYVNGEGKLDSGALVEITFKQWPEAGRILGVVVRTGEKPGFAVKFADFVGSARSRLHGLLTEAA